MEPDGRMREAAGPLFVQEWPGPGDRPGGGPGGGPGAGPTFVLLHGLGGSHVNWMRLAPLLARRGRVLVPDMPGCGKTPAAGRRVGLASARRSVEALIREVGSPVVLVGNSMGGTTAVLVAATAPSLCSGVALCGPALPPRDDPPALVRAVASAYGLTLASDFAGRVRVSVLPPERYVAASFRLVTADPRALPPEVQRAHADMMATVQADPEAGRNFASAARSILSFLVRPGAGGYLDAVRCPVMLCQGGKDRVVPAGMSVAAARPGWETHLWPDLGHLVQLEDPERTMAAIDAWLAANLG